MTPCDKPPAELLLWVANTSRLLEQATEDFLVYRQAESVRSNTRTPVRSGGTDSGAQWHSGASFV